MHTCENAVVIATESRKASWLYRDSRGLARALTGNIDGAIEDFQAFIDNADNDKQKVRRQHWIKALRVGENPFTQIELESLKTE